MGFFRWNGKIEGKAKMKVVASDHSLQPPTDTNGNYDPSSDSPDAMSARRQGKLPITSNIPKSENVIASLPQPWEAGAGFRYAMLHTTSVDPSRPQHLDPMATEVFDIEANFVFEHNSTVDQLLLSTDGNTIINTFSNYDPADVNATGNPTPIQADLPLLPEQAIPRNWKDQYSFRLGGDYNVLPNVLALRAGVNYETSGVRAAYASIDAIPARRVGVHIGLTWRVMDYDLSVAYGHIFQETLRALPNPGEVAPEDDASGQLAQLRANSPDPNAFIANQGTFRVRWDVLSVGVTQRF